ncbi:LPS O-antigen chain length determinant protein WzzB [Aromatoleum diolicum]|uniref:Polysaccharide chain length determinant N-terminal domain-containing protein n=1 Tax=Aromatoleum diolicum TaxID=75796 RepID=A0ABX1Q9Y1_9RHOO|nr:GNVR domain-containing protein [Aromatoleum diolicum]NMG73930.1 hypothetical protein [Aromatoleum diolicum]
MSGREHVLHHISDDLHLIDLWEILLRRRLEIAVCFLVCIVIGVAYALLATPRYEVDVYLDKPFASDLAALNLGRSPATGLVPFEGAYLFGYFLSSLVSEHTLQRFFAEVYLPSLDEQVSSEPKHLLYEKMVRSIRISKPDPKGRGLFNLKVEADSGEKAVQRSAAFLSLAAAEATSKFVEDARNEIDLTVRNAERDLAELRLTVSRKREDRLVQLSEALQVAQAVGLTNPEITNARLPEQDGLRPWMDGSQLYARGSKSLRAELEVLKKRESDDPFIASLRDTEARLRQLKAVHFDPKSVRVFNTDGEIVVPTKPVAPKKLLVVVFASLLGLMFGVAFAFVVEFLTTARERAPRSRVASRASFTEAMAAE